MSTVTDRTITVKGTEYGLDVHGWGFRLSKPDDDGTCYDVTRCDDKAVANRDGWFCTCPDHERRHAGLGTAGCKHYQALKSAGLTTVTQEEPFAYRFASLDSNGNRAAEFGVRQRRKGGEIWDVVDIGANVLLAGHASKVDAIRHAMSEAQGSEPTIADILAVISGDIPPAPEPDPIPPAPQPEPAKPAPAFSLKAPEHQKTLALSADTPALQITERYRPATIADIRGQGCVQLELETFVESPYSCAFLFVGPTGIGKTTAALALAKALGAGEFSGLTEIKSGMQDADAVEMALNNLRFTPMFSQTGWKVVIVDEADYMSQKASNLWLSALEDLPQKSVVIFTTNRPEKFPDRFVDRCIPLHFESRADVLSQDAQCLVDSIWAREGMDGPPPRLSELGRLTDDNGAMSFRRVVQAVGQRMRLTIARRKAELSSQPIAEPIPAAAPIVEPAPVDVATTTIDVIPAPIDHAMTTDLSMETLQGFSGGFYNASLSGDASAYELGQSVWRALIDPQTGNPRLCESIYHSQDVVIDTPAAPTDPQGPDGLPQSADEWRQLADELESARDRAATQDEYDRLHHAFRHAFDRALTMERDAERKRLEATYPVEPPPGFSGDPERVVTHPWEVKGMGKAPYRYLGRAGIREIVKMGYNVAAFIACDACGTIITRVHMVEDAEGKRFLVGSDCILKVGDSEMITRIEAQIRAENRERSRARSAAKREEKRIQAMQDRKTAPQDNAWLIEAFRDSRSGWAHMAIADLERKPLRNFPGKFIDAAERIFCEVTGESREVFRARLV